MIEGRKTEASGVREYLFGDFRIDISRYQLWREDQLVTLTPKAFDTLVVLLQHRDRAVGKDELLSSVWPDSSVSEDSLTQSISVLRKTLGDDPAHPLLIATIARRGYRFIAPVVELPVDDPSSEMDALPVSSSVGVAPVIPPAPVEPANRGFLSWGPWLGGALLGGLAVFAASMIFPRMLPAPKNSPPDIPPMRFSVAPPPRTSILSGGTLSPNGRYLILLAQDDSSEIGRIWVRSMDTGQSRPIAATEGAARPFWSPDSQFIGFFAGGKLKRVGIDNQAAQVISAAGTNTSGGTWGSNGTIVFADQRSGLYAVPESGGEPTSLTTLNPADQEVAHRWPQFLPDGEHYLYFDVSGKSNRAGTYLGSLHSKQAERVFDVPALFAQPGYLIYSRDRLLMAQRFDLSYPHTHQEPKMIAGITFAAGSINENYLSSANLSVSANGLLAFTNAEGTPRIKWFDRSGREGGSVDMPASVHNPVWSPDQKQVLVGGRNLDHGVWMVDLARGVSTRIESDGMRPLWSPDGTQVAFSADRAGANSLFLRPASGGNDAALLLRTAYNKILDDWSADGRYLLFTSVNPDTKLDLWLLPMFGERKPVPFLQTSFNEVQGQISPDVHWIAYTSDESGSWEVYLQSFPNPGGKRIISIGGGAEPHWRKDGKELFYLSPERKLMAVSITLGTEPAIAKPHALFRAPVLAVSNVFRDQFAVSADGQRFLIGSVERPAKDDLITVLSSWPNLLAH